MGRNHNLWLNFGAFGVIGGVALLYVKGSFSAVAWPMLGIFGVIGLVQLSFRLGGSTVHEEKAPPPPVKPAAPKAKPAIVMEDLRVVREVGRYALVKELGRGAFGTVYKAVDTNALDRFWAIKEMELTRNRSALKGGLASSRYGKAETAYGFCATFSDKVPDVCSPTRAGYHRGKNPLREPESLVTLAGKAGATPANWQANCLL